MKIIYKKTGETPLEVIERFRNEQKIDADIPLTYAGRLDPMAEGQLLVLVGEECKRKDEYLGLDKEYEVEIVFGMSTDTHDALGLVTNVSNALQAKQDKQKESIDFSKYVRKFTQPYPQFSSPVIDGKSGSKEVEIYSIELLKESEIRIEDLKRRIFDDIALVKGQFRQQEIIMRWNEVFDSYLKSTQGNIFKFPIITIRVKCSAGTYMRSLAHNMGQDIGVGAFALHINRIAIVMPE